MVLKLFYMFIFVISGCVTTCCGMQQIIIPKAQFEAIREKMYKAERGLAIMLAPQIYGNSVTLYSADICIIKQTLGENVFGQN